MFPVTITISSRLRFFIFLAFVLQCNFMQSQSWDDDSKKFVSDASRNRYKYSVSEIRGSINKSTAIINSYCKTCSPEILSSVYLARANLRTFLLEWQQDSVGDNYTPPAAAVSKIKTDFVMAQSFCQSCKCGMYDNIMGFYANYGTEKQIDSLEKVAKAMGKPTDHNYIGLQLGYLSQQHIASVEFGILNAWTVRQPKRWMTDGGKKYRKCKYDYPMAIGFAFFGYETSFTNSKYNGFKIDPVWLNYIFSIHPAQIIYADYKTGKSFIYRPEIGLSFSTFAINYAMNIPFNESFGFLSQHNLSIRFCIPTIKLR